MREEREYVRLDTAKDVRYKVLSEKGHLDSKSKNISAGGIRFFAKESLEPKAILDLVIYLGEEYKPVTAMGEVVWSRKLERQIDSKGYEIGVKFTAIEKSDCTKINEFVHRETMKRRKSSS